MTGNSGLVLGARDDERKTKTEAKRVNKEIIKRKCDLDIIF